MVKADTPEQRYQTWHAGAKKQRVFLFRKVLGQAPPGLRQHKQQIQRKVAPAHPQREFAADKAEITAQPDQEILELLQQALVQIGLQVAGLQVQELDQIAVLEHAQHGMGLLQRG